MNLISRALLTNLIQRALHHEPYPMVVNREPCLTLITHSHSHARSLEPCLTSIAKPPLYYVAFKNFLYRAHHSHSHNYSTQHHGPCRIAATDRQHPVDLAGDNEGPTDSQISCRCP